MTKKDPLLITPKLQAQMLKELMASHLAVQRAEQRLKDAVCMARASDLDGHCALSWHEIGNALMITKQAAQQRFSQFL